MLVAALLPISVVLLDVGGDHGSALAQPRPPVRPPTRPPTRPIPSATPSPADAGTAFRTHFGIELATNLVRSSDPDERLRGIERAASLGGADARIVLTQALSNAPPGAGDSLATSSATARRDGRALVAATRGLAKELLDEVRGARTVTGGAAAASPPAARASAVDGGLVVAPRTLGLINALVPVLEAAPSVGPAPGARPELVELARGIAARALALSADPRAIEALVKAARDVDAGRAPASAAVAALRSRISQHGASELLLPPNLSPEVVRIAGETSDLRAVEPLLQATRASDARLRGAAIVALAELGAVGAGDPARALLRDPNPTVRVAAGAALVKIGAPDAATIVAALLADDATAPRAIALAEHVESPEVVAALDSRARRPADESLQRRAVAGLSRQRAEAAAVALARLVSDSVLRADVVGALGRSRASNAGSLLAALARDPATRRLGVRGLALRALVHGIDQKVALEHAAPLATTGDVEDRALYMFVHVALGVYSVETGLAERDADARVATLMGALARLDERACRAIATRRPSETDPSVKALMGIGLTCPNGAEGTSSGELWSRARDGGPDGPLSLLVLASRSHERDGGEMFDWLGSPNPLVRAHVAAGLGSAAREDVPGRLARALLYEAEPSVRRVLVRAIARNGRDAPSGREALEATRLLDPEDDVRALAEAALDGTPLPRLSEPRETAWLHLATSTGASGGRQLASVVRSDSLAAPIAFDRDGFAIVPGLPPGAIHLVLAPRLPRLQAP